jgi:hypothetical protein
VEVCGRPAAILGSFDGRADTLGGTQIVEDSQQHSKDRTWRRERTRRRRPSETPPTRPPACPTARPCRRIPPVSDIPCRRECTSPRTGSQSCSACSSQGCSRVAPPASTQAARQVPPSAGPLPERLNHSSSNPVPRHPSSLPPRASATACCSGHPFRSTPAGRCGPPPSRGTSRSSRPCSGKGV